MKYGGVFVTRDILRDTVKSVQDLTRARVLVGIPRANAPREGEQEVNNAMLGYVHEFGSPAQKIPARPHLVPGVKKIEPQIIKLMTKTAQDALTAGSKGQSKNERDREIDKTLNKVGLACVAAIQQIIRAGIPPGLAESTLKARARRKPGRGIGISKGAKAELAYRSAHPEAGASITSTTPLIDTGEYWRKITYIIDRLGTYAKGVAPSADSLILGTDNRIIDNRAVKTGELPIQKP